MCEAPFSTLWLSGLAWGPWRRTCGPAPARGPGRTGGAGGSRGERRRRRPRDSFPRGTRRAAERALGPTGGRLNRRKCKAWSPGATEPPGLPEGLWQQDGLLLLGTPHGEGPDRGQEAPLPPGTPTVPEHPQKTLEEQHRAWREEMDRRISNKN